MAWYKRAEERLVKFLMEDWQRRGSHFLHIGLHAPLIPEFFWDSGFDVTVCEENHHAVEESLLRSGPRISYQLGKFDDLPFENDSFDYAFFLYTQLTRTGKISVCQALCREKCLRRPFLRNFAALRSKELFLLPKTVFL